MYKSKIAVILAGELSNLSNFKSSIIQHDYTIAVDAGLKYLKIIDIKPDILIGDMDTIDIEDLEWANKNNLSKLVFPTNKDKTDGELALEYALKFNPQKISLYGMWGNYRPDHALNMLNLAYKLKENSSIDITLIQDEFIALPLVGPEDINIDIDDFYPNIDNKNIVISIVPNSNIKELSYENLYYDLSNANIDYCSSLTLSNKLKDSRTFKLSFTSGYLTIFILKLNIY